MVKRPGFCRSCSAPVWPQGDCSPVQVCPGGVIKECFSGRVMHELAELLRDSREEHGHEELRQRRIPDQEGVVLLVLSEKCCCFFNLMRFFCLHCDQGHVVHNWKARWFVLTPDKLLYFKYEGGKRDSSQRGKILLKDCVITCPFLEYENRPVSLWRSEEKFEKKVRSKT